MRGSNTKPNVESGEGPVIYSEHFSLPLPGPQFGQCCIPFVLLPKASDAVGSPFPMSAMFASSSNILLLPLQAPWLPLLLVPGCPIILFCFSKCRQHLCKESLH